MTAMRQAIHIFRKDVRHCWPYIAVVLAATAVGAWLSCRDTFHSSIIADALVPFPVSLAWWLAIATVVHGENLVGDRQFWVTRPYSWKSLMAAKMLFLAVFVGLPIFVSDCIILYTNAFNPLRQVPGLMLHQCWLAVVLVLPFVLATLTSTAGEFLVAGLAFFVYFYLEWLLFVCWIGRLPLKPEWVLYGTLWLLPLLGLSLAVWQYARRRTAFLRLVALVLGLLTPVLTVPPLVGPTVQMCPVSPGFKASRFSSSPVGGHAATGGWVRISRFSGAGEVLMACTAPKPQGPESTHGAGNPGATIYRVKTP